MSMTDPIADLLTRIRNAVQARHETVAVPRSKLKLEIVKVLKSEGYIEGFRAVLSPVKMGLDHVAFAEVKLTNTHEDALRAFNEAVKKIPEVEECHMIAGRFDYLLKIRTRDIRRYRHVLGERNTGVVAGLDHHSPDQVLYADLHSGINEHP